MITTQRNRITEGIEKCKKVLAAKAKDLTAAQLEKADRELDMEYEEYSFFQQEKSLAMMDGRLTADEAQTVYSYLGNTPHTFNQQPLEVKVVLTQVLASLLKGRR